MNVVEVTVRTKDDTAAGIKSIQSSHGKLISGLKNSLAGLGASLAASGGLAMAAPLAAAATAVVGFAAVAGPELSKVQAALSKTGAAGRQAWKQLTPQERELGGAIKGVESSFHDLQTTLAPVVDDVVTLAARTAKDLMPALGQMASAGSSVLSSFLEPFDRLVQSPFFQKFVDAMTKGAVQIGLVMGPVLVKLIRQLMKLFIELMPIGVSLLRQLLPAFVTLFKAMVPGVVILANIVAAVVRWLAVNHLLIPALLALGVVILVITGPTGIAGIGIAISLLAITIGFFATHWRQIWQDIKNWTIDAWHWLYSNVFAKLIVFFTKTIPAVLDIFKEDVRLAWDDIKIAFFRGVLYILNIMGKLPGPLGAPFRAAAKDIRSTLNGVLADVRNAANNIQADFSRLHGKSLTISIFGKNDVNSGLFSLPGHAAGTSGAAPGWAWVGERGPELVRMRGGETVIPNHAIRGFAAGTTGWNITDVFSPPVGAFLSGVNRSVYSAEDRIANAMARAIQRAAAREVASGSLPTGPHSGSASAAMRYAMSILGRFGWSGAQWPPLYQLWQRESGWNAYAVNPSSGAYGIPQSLGHGHPYNLGDYIAQIWWGLRYIAGRYGSPAAAWGHEVDFGWYDHGGYLKPGWTMAYNGTGRPEPVGAAAGATVVLEIAPGGGTAFDQFMSTWLRKNIRIKGGGDVQAAYGRN